MDGRMDGQTDGWMDEWLGRSTYERESGLLLKRLGRSLESGGRGGVAEWAAETHDFPAGFEVQEAQYGIIDDFT